MLRLQPLRSSILVSLLFLATNLLRADIAAANQALQQGRVEDATNLLHAWIAQHPDDASAHLLLCRVFYAQNMADRAVGECESAAESASSSGDAQLWLGRAYGMKAGSANPVLAFSLARKVHEAFERSIRLNPGNVAAMGDLGEFYVAAPAIVGGGAGKARALAETLQASSQPDAQSQAHRVLALLAEKNNDLPTAEAEFRRATSPAVAVPWNSGAWIDLGAFYSRHQQPDQAVVAVRTALSVDRVRGANLVDAASILTTAHRQPELAIRLLREYLASPARSDAAPAFKIRLQLGDLLARSGDLASARREYAAALALAPNFPPARDANLHPETTRSP